MKYKYNLPSHHYHPTLSFIEMETGNSFLVLDNDEVQLEKDKTRIVSKLSDIHANIKIIDTIHCGGSDLFILSLDSLEYEERIKRIFSAAAADLSDDDMNPLQYEIEKTKHKMPIKGWVHLPSRTTLSIRRLALKKIGRIMFFRVLLKALMMFIGFYILLLLYAINT